MAGDEKRLDARTLFSTAWIFVTLNYLYCDLITMMDTPVLKQFLTGSIGNLQITQGFLLGASLLMEIPISMVILSRLLKRKANRWANIVAGTIMTLVQCGSMFFGTAPTIYYIFFSIIEILTTALIVLHAVKWRPAEQSV